MKHRVTWHAISRDKKMQLIAILEEKQLISIPKKAVELLTNETLIQFIEGNDWYDPIQDPEIIFYGEVVRNPERHAVRVKL